MKCRNCGCEMKLTDLYCPNCGLAREQAMPEKEIKVDTRGMAWYKFLIYISLFLSAVMNILGGISQITGGYYAGQADVVYESFPTLRPIDIAVGVITVALGAFALYTRFRLAKFRQNGPKCLYLLYAGNILTSVLYAVAASAVIGQSALDITGATQLIGSLIMLGLNMVYFGKRDDLFIN